MPDLPYIESTHFRVATNEVNIMYGKTIKEEILKVKRTAYQVQARKNGPVVDIVLLKCPKGKPAKEVWRGEICCQDFMASALFLSRDVMGVFKIKTPGELDFYNEIHEKVRGFLFGLEGYASQVTKNLNS